MLLFELLKCLLCFLVVFGDDDNFDCCHLLMMIVRLKLYSKPLKYNKEGCEKTQRIVVRSACQIVRIKNLANVMCSVIRTFMVSDDVACFLVP